MLHGFPRTAVAVFALAAVSIVSRPVHAQSHPTAPRGHDVARPLDSGFLGNAANRPQTVFSEIVQEKNAAWMRLHFGDITLAPGSRVRFSSLLDGEVQELDSAGCAMWSNASAYFNGESVRVELIAAPQSLHNRLVLERLTIEMPGEQAEGGIAGAPGFCGICGSDSRIPSNEPWTGRLMNVGCTASLYNACGCIVSAGHCVGVPGLVLQFNVPPSLPNCNLVNPPVADQFPVLSQQFDNDGPGEDWAVMRTGTNNLGQTAVQRYHTYRRVGSIVSGTTGSAINVWGYGVDLTCIRNQTQQLSPGGAVNDVASSVVLFNADVRGGNSGSGLMRLDRFIGVVTHCTDGCPNIATRIDVPAFAAARTAVCNCAPCPADVVPTGEVDVDDLVAVILAWGNCAAPVQFCATDTNADSTTDVDDLVAVILGWGLCDATP